MWRDLLSLVELEETLADVSALADSCVEVAMDVLYRQLCERHGTPYSRAKGGKEAVQQHMLVLAMGKHGANELNVSSDIDLIFAYPESGETDHPKKPIENQLFFTRLGQKLINALDATNADGFVFRVDMRLRPYGDSGSLVMNFASLEDYYHNQGREWERYAMIKARVVNADAHPEASSALANIITPFVYRKYADFTSIQALRDMKRMIMAEMHRKGGEQNIKLGDGGIREIEFIAQACQLIYGGRDESLQQTGLVAIYKLLQESEYLPSQWIDTLLAAYRFLRNLEHAIQGLADQQTQLIPDTDEGKLRISWSMGYQSWEDLHRYLSAHRAAVSQCFADFLHDPEEDGEQEKTGRNWVAAWRSEDRKELLGEMLAEAGYDAPDQSLAELEQLSEHRMFTLMSPEAKRRFEAFLPLLLEEVSETSKPSVTLSRMLGLVEAILGRSVYFVLLYENAGALKQLCRLCAESPWVSEHIAKSPVILDELLDARSLFNPPNREQLQDELRQQMLRIPEDDLESQMNCLRTFKQSHMLRVAASELGGHLPLMKVSDYLTWLAEVLLEESLAIAWSNLVAKHGIPGDVRGEVPEGSQGISGEGFAAIGYGKLGGLELGYSSDLDMVFLYDANDQGVTSGPKQIDNQVFYMRLGQRVIHILSAQTTQGMLYETDMRLRPSGNSGMLVSSLAAFKKYQENDAWTWEHQALVRARGIAGDPKLIEGFNKVRCEILSAKRDEAQLKEEVIKMRQKMKDAFDPSSIKQGDGGLVDIEFITQFSVLNFASDFPEIMEWTDNVRILEVLEKIVCFEGVNFATLSEAYRELRSALHRNSLADESDKVDITAYSSTAANVSHIWQKVF
jgi:glutamate-ammonia-ligase adenylyltransferase